MSTVKEALEPVARCTTPDEVAQLLRANGIQGFRGTGSSCPLAVYLRRQSGLPALHVTRLAVYAEGLYEGVLSPVALPLAARQFVAMFDQGDHYADLRASRFARSAG